MTGSDEKPGLHLFEGYGIEIEYAIVHASSLSVLPVADRLLERLAGHPASDVTLGRIACSNELVLHVFELKTAEPSDGLEGLAAAFSQAISRATTELSDLGGRLMPTAMHPFMDPATETHLWPHDNDEIYRAFDRIFGCTGHGWSNLQSVHLNLPFQGDDEFGRLHAAIRLALPLLPSLAASSPIVEGRATGICDNRMEYYRFNARRVPSVAGKIIPERVFSRKEYEEVILGKIASDLSPLDHDGVLEPEWTNSRGAIARFIRDTIEVRVIDSQECPTADLAVAAATAALVRALVEEKWASYSEQREIDEHLLHDSFVTALHSGGQGVLTDPRLLALYDMPVRPARLSDVWHHLIERLIPEASEFYAPLQTIARRGTLSERILARLGTETSASRVTELYRELCECLLADRMLE